MRNQPNAVMLFAAGFGTRMGALTADRPKPLIKVAGKALIDHALDLVAGAKIEKSVVNLHYKGEQIAAHLSDRPDIGLLKDQRQGTLENFPVSQYVGNAGR